MDIVHTLHFAALHTGGSRAAGHSKHHTTIIRRCCKQQQQQQQRQQRQWTMEGADEHTFRIQQQQLIFWKYAKAAIGWEYRGRGAGAGA
eukprot:1157438-Pelagomonas_calceolata.AAC.4